MNDIIEAIGIIILVYGAVSWHFIKARAGLAEQNENVAGTDRERYGN